MQMQAFTCWIEFYASDVMGTIRDPKNSSCPQKRMQESSRQYQNMHKQSEMQYLDIPLAMDSNSIWL